MKGAYHAWLTAALATFALQTPPLGAQFLETEPNQTCAQVQGPSATFEDIPLEIGGELSPGPVDGASGDVDFYYFEAPGGTRLAALLGWEAEPSSSDFRLYLGLFDTNCNPITGIATDFYASYPDGMFNRIDISPAAGGLVPFYLGVTGSDDLLYAGSHFRTDSYTLRLVELEEPVQAIQGRIIDALSGQAIQRNWEVRLYRCLGEDCSHLLADRRWEWFSRSGMFQFEFDERGSFLLDAGTYMIRIVAQDYSDEQLGPFEAGPGEHVDLGDIELQPVGLVFENTIPCEDLPVEGGYCIYLTLARNYTGISVDGLYWNTVAGRDWSPLGPTIYQPQRSRRVLIEPYSYLTLQSRFRVPFDLPVGSVITVFGHLSDRSFGHFSVLRSQPLFTLVKTESEFLVLEGDYPPPP